MKKLVVFLLSVVIFFNVTRLNADNLDHLYFGVEASCDKLLIKKAYISCFNYTTKNSDWVTYTVTDKMVSGYNKRKDDFKEDYSLEDEYRSTLKDYKNSGYDRGHLMPNAMADYSIETQKESFLLSNVVPQLPQHNRTIWKKLEEEVRELIKKEKELIIFTGVLYGKNYKTIGNKIAVPSYFYKVILSPYNLKTWAFLIPHKNFTKSFNTKEFQTKVDEIEELTGFNYFSNLENEVQENIESKIFDF